MTDMNVSINRVATQNFEQISNANSNIEKEEIPGSIIPTEGEDNIASDNTNILNKNELLGKEVIEKAKKILEEAKKEDEAKEPSFSDILHDFFQRPELSPDVTDVDSNGDGKITQEELLNYGSDKIARNPWDKNDDMDASFEEYSADKAYTQQMHQITEEKAQKYQDAGFKVHKDANGKYYVSPQVKAEYEYENKDLSRKLDSDNDGVISEKEIMSAYMDEYDQKIRDDSMSAAFNPFKQNR